MMNFGKAKFLITGGNGQLAKAFIEIFERNNANYLATDIEKLDITKIEKLYDACKEYKPNFLINCAAFNNVDTAETDYEFALKVNFHGPKNIATLSAELNFKAIHFSTDYVFPGKSEYIPYKETDETCPINKYGLSKLKGEKIFLEISPKNLVFRVSWLYGKGKQNFIYKLLQWIKNQDEVLVANDEISTPTNTFFVAENVLKSLEISGLYHLVPDGFVSRYDYAKLVLNILKIDKSLKPIKSEFFKLPAKRPNFSALSSELFFNITKRENKHWSEFLISFLKDTDFLID